MRNYKAKDVDGYIAGAEKAARGTLKHIRSVIRSTVPKADEGISWGVPFYKYHGVLAGFSAFKNHATFGLAFALDSKDREALERKGYTTGNKTVQIRFDQKVPVAIIRRMLKTRVKENLTKR